MTAVDDAPQRGTAATPAPLERWWEDPLLGVELLLAFAYTVVRSWQTWGVGPMVFQDSLKNLQSAGFGLFSSELWMGQRTPLVPLVMKLTGTTQQHLGPFLVTQVALGALAWVLFAFTVGRRLPGAWRWVGSVVVLLLGLTTPITMWDHVVLTESLSVTFLVLTTTTGIWLIERQTWPRTIAFSAAAFGLVALRDSHIVLSGLLALGVLAVIVVRLKRRQAFLPTLAVLLVVLVALTAFGRLSTMRGERYIQAVRETLFVKILPYEDRFDWFAAHGMPDVDRLRELRTQMYLDPQTKAPLFPLPSYDDPAWADFNRWVRDDGDGVYNRWLATHPVDALGDYFRRPKRIWNSAGDGWAFYRNRTFKQFKLVDIDLLLFPPLWVVTLVAGGAFAVLYARRPRWWRSSLGITSLVLLATGVPHALASYLGDPAEVSRHALVSIVQLRLGLLLLILLALPELRPRRDASPAR